MNKNSLLYKMITSFTTILAVILVVNSIFLTFVYKNYFYNEKFELISKESKILTDVIVDSIDGNDISKVKNKVDEFNLLTDIEVGICDSNNLLYVSTKGFNRIAEDNKICIEDKYLSRLKKGEVLKYGEIVQKDGNNHDVYLEPILNEGEHIGIIAMTLSNNENMLFKGYKTIWISTLITLLVALIFINYFTKRQLIYPLKEIYLVANKLARGEVNQRIAVKSSDEIGELAKSFNLMAESLEAVDSNRRDFISNVSHELRSPITSMKGFIAGMLDGVIPKDKENYYLKLVYDEINRLSRLVGDLLDISSMEVGKFKLTIMEVDINEIVKRCLLNLESKVNSAGIRINVTLENEHLYVYADSDRIMQVLTNLLDNAIKYGKDDGIIDVSTRIKGPKVHISVYNNGSKMTEEEMAHIWDRFYKSDKSRTNKESTGLGLPIVRLIMTQHKEDVWVRNEREGVVFTFTLAKV